MNIFGIGVDIVKNSRIKKILLSNYSERFIQKVLHPNEIQQLKDKGDVEQQTSYLASRWSFKEACVKATGRKDLIFPQMYLDKEPNGKPTVTFVMFNKNLIQDELKIKETHVSISHEDDTSIAFVVMTKGDDKL